MATYVNDLRLKEIATGDESGTWGTSTNTNLELIAEAFSFGTEAITTNADTHTTTIADGSTDPGRSLYLKYTGTLDSACTITLAPNTVSKVWFIENATSGSQNIIISQGSGSNVTIPNGSVMAVYSDGGGGSANIVSVLTDVVLTDSVKIIKASVGAFTPTTGADNFIIEDAADVGISLMTANDATAKICFGHPSDPDEGQISYTHDSDDQMTFTAGSAFAFKKGSTSQATINSGGDLSILTADKGLILKSANGTSYRVTVSNAGALVVTAV